MREVANMKKSLLARLIILFVALTTLPGCIIVPHWWDGHHGHGHGGHHGGHGGHSGRR